MTEVWVSSVVAGVGFIAARSTTKVFATARREKFRHCEKRSDVAIQKTVILRREAPVTDCPLSSVLCPPDASQ
jgi:hypothetical protein